MEKTPVILELLKFNFDKYVSRGNAVGTEEMRGDFRVWICSTLGLWTQACFVYVLTPQLARELRILVEEGQL